MSRLRVVVVVTLAVVAAACRAAEPPGGAPTLTASPIAPAEPSPPSPSPPPPSPDPSPEPEPEGEVVALGPEGAYLARPLDLGAEPAGEGDCPVAEHEERRIPRCVVVAGSGGRFAVLVAESGDSFQAEVHREVGGGAAWEGVWATPTYERLASDVYDVVVMLFESGGEPAALVDYDLGGSGAVHAFDIVTWEAGAERPTPVAHIRDRPHAFVLLQPPGVYIESSNFDDGAPTCCPNHRDLSEVWREAQGRWLMRTQTVPVEG